jgi:hypothetical protein
MEHIIITDDYPNIKASKHKERYNEIIAMRLKRTGKVIFIQGRLHESDLIGRCKK